MHGRWHTFYPGTQKAGWWPVSAAIVEPCLKLHDILIFMGVFWWPKCISLHLYIKMIHRWIAFPIPLPSVVVGNPRRVMRYLRDITMALMKTGK